MDLAAEKAVRARARTTGSEAHCREPLTTTGEATRGQAGQEADAAGHGLCVMVQAASPYPHTNHQAQTTTRDARAQADLEGQQAGKQAGQASKQASRQASKQASQASKQASQTNRPTKGPVGLGGTSEQW
ncbi:hypothetical protein CDD81_2789 [Ophiocordyceps australis]|uniref:Uncharacterized protein n=1 Tax=Ophiocordyceps australis TaxID=1399860 RepID=A0A2C5XYD3_9HYPO|nr:hypothetical protein CDD81_2789 [Ophiocordyceps australis]